VLTNRKTVLSTNPGDEEVIQCRLYCLVQLGKFDDVVVATTGRDAFALQRAYALYRLGKLNEALEAVPKGDSVTSRRLLGQIVRSRI